LGAKGSVHPRRGGQIKSIAEDKALARALSDIGNEETGCADLAAGGGRGVREPDEGHAEKPKVGVDERDASIQTDPRVGRVELPLGVLGIADGG